MDVLLLQCYFYDFTAFECVFTVVFYNRLFMTIIFRLYVFYNLQALQLYSHCKGSAKYKQNFTEEDVKAITIDSFTLFFGTEAYFWIEDLGFPGYTTISSVIGSETSKN